MAKELVTVRTCAIAEEAHALRNLLESAGIAAFVEDEAASGMLWYNVVGGAKVQVAEEDLERAREVLAEQPMPSDELKKQALAQEPELSEECSEDEQRL